MFRYYPPPPPFKGLCLFSVYLTWSAMTLLNQEVEEFTDSFCSNRLNGKGGFGKVYKGMFRHTEVAVKLLSKVILCKYMNAPSNVSA